MALDLAMQMRAAMRRLASGVCVITSEDHNQKRCAMTVSSVTSVSDDPASVLVCINQTARIDNAIESSGKFAINLLAMEHEQVSSVCATPDKIEERFNVGDWVLDTDSGLWYLESAPAAIFCERAKKITHGTHNIYIGNILSTRLSDANKEMLAYMNGRYRYLPLTV